MLYTDRPLFFCSGLRQALLSVAQQLPDYDKADHNVRSTVLMWLAQIYDEAAKELGHELTHDGQLQESDENSQDQRNEIYQSIEQLFKEKYQVHKKEITASFLRIQGKQPE